MSSGIQALLKTEKDAAEVVSEARKYRTSRLKNAKVDAQKEIDQYRKQKEDELKMHELQYAGLNDKFEKEADTEVKKEMAAIQAKFAEKKKSVVQLLVNAATQPTPEMHINATKE